MATDLQKTNGNGQPAEHSDGLRRSVPPDAGAMVRPSSPPRSMAPSQNPMGGTAYNQAQASPIASPARVPRTLHRVSFSAEQVDALAKREALAELSGSGFIISNQMQFAQASVVIRRDDGGLDVEVHS